MAVLAIIPARGGSKGIPRKNIRSLAGRPLIAWTISAAKCAIGIDRTIVSTDDEEIAKVCMENGAEVPFMRPRELARDNTPGLAPVLHALDMLPGFDSILLLQPTSPLRSTADIQAVLAIASETGAPSVVSVNEVTEHPNWMYHRSEDGLLHPLMANEKTSRRQDLPPLYVLNGAIYYAKADWLRKHGSFIGPDTIGYPMPVERSVDIDEMLDWYIAEMLLEQQQ